VRSVGEVGDFGSGSVVVRCRRLVNLRPSPARLRVDFRREEVGAGASVLDAVGLAGNVAVEGDLADVLEVDVVEVEMDLAAGDISAKDLFFKGVDGRGATTSLSSSSSASRTIGNELGSSTMISLPKTGAEIDTGMFDCCGICDINGIGGVPDNDSLPVRGVEGTCDSSAVSPADDNEGRVATVPPVFDRLREGVPLPLNADDGSNRFGEDVGEGPVVAVIISNMSISPKAPNEPSDGDGEGGSGTLVGLRGPGPRSNVGFEGLNTIGGGTCALRGVDGVTARGVVMSRVEGDADGDSLAVRKESCDAALLGGKIPKVAEPGGVGKVGS
jgi:hypothetical protein